MCYFKYYSEYDNLFDDDLNIISFWETKTHISNFITRKKKAKKDFYLFVDVTQTIYFFSLSEKSMSYVLDEALKAF